MIPPTGATSVHFGQYCELRKERLHDPDVTSVESESIPDWQCYLLVALLPTLIGPSGKVSNSEMKYFIRCESPLGNCSPVGST